MRRDSETNLTAEESFIASKISRRGFMGRAQPPRPRWHRSSAPSPN